MKLKTDPESIHLTSFPKADATLIDENLTAAMDAVARINSMALAARKQKDLRVRQPLAELIIYPADKIEEDACNQFTDIFVEELNIKKVTVLAVDSDMPVTLSIKANFKVLGPRFGKGMKDVAAEIALFNDQAITELKAGNAQNIQLNGETIAIEPAEVVITATPREDLSFVEDGKTSVAIVTTITEELQAEGLMRDLLRRLQQLRKESDLELEDRISLSYQTTSEKLLVVVDTWKSYLMEELLCLELTPTTATDGLVELDLQGEKMLAVIKKVEK
jgi:isoleucyl-tRNA synthetase